MVPAASFESTRGNSPGQEIGRIDRLIGYSRFGRERRARGSIGGGIDISLKCVEIAEMANYSCWSDL